MSDFIKILPSPPTNFNNVNLVINPRNNNEIIIFVQQCKRRAKENNLNTYIYSIKEKSYTKISSSYDHYCDIITKIDNKLVALSRTKTNE